MRRKDFLKRLAMLPLIGAGMQLQDLKKWSDTLTGTDRMPVVFIGHGAPTNATDENEFVRGWREITRKIPRPQAILCVSAHWETRGTFVTAMDHPKTIHDFGGFAKELYEVNYPAPGSMAIATEVQKAVQMTNVGLDQSWGLDHGAWVPIMKMYPDADIPVLQLSLDVTKPAQYHYDLAKQLSALRKKGVLIVGSGNMVHNLRMIRFSPSGNFNEEYGFTWAYEMNDLFKQKITQMDHQPLINFESLGAAARLAIPTTDHYYPLLYTLALQDKDEQAIFFNDKAIAGSLTMTSVLIGTG